MRYFSLQSNPLIRVQYETAHDYSVELKQPMEHPEVRDFMTWMQERIIRYLGPEISGSFLNVVRRIA